MQPRIIIVAAALVLLGAGCANEAPVVSAVIDAGTATNIVTTAATSTEVIPPAPQLASSWKTYTNAKSGYSLEYPSDWTVVRLDDGDVAFASPELTQALKEFHDRGILGETGASYDFLVEYWPTFGDFVPQSGFENSTATNTKDLIVAADASVQGILAPNETTLDGKKAVEFTMFGLDATYEVLVEHGGIFSLQFPSFENRSQLTPNLQRVLSSFRFTK
jgi:hypothetical protein